VSARRIDDLLVGKLTELTKAGTMTWEARGKGLETVFEATDPSGRTYRIRPALLTGPSLALVTGGDSATAVKAGFRARHAFFSAADKQIKAARAAQISEASGGLE
jgi:hypothetical protein